MCFYVSKNNQNYDEVLRYFNHFNPHFSMIVII